MTTNYHLANIRTLLIEGFSETELCNFCFDTPEFRPVYHELAELTGKAKIASQFLEFADQRELIDTLLIWAQKNNPAKFARYQPYVIPSASEESPAPVASKSAETTTPPPPPDSPTHRETPHFVRSDMPTESPLSTPSPSSFILHHHPSDSPRTGPHPGRRIFHGQRPGQRQGCPTP